MVAGAKAGVSVPLLSTRLLRLAFTLAARVTVTVVVALLPSWAVTTIVIVFVPTARAIAPEGVNLVLDMVGGDYVARNIACLADEGRHVSIAVQRGATAEIPVWKIMQKRLTLTGSTLRARDVGFKTHLRDQLVRTVWPLLADGRLKPVIDSTFPLAQAAEAHRRLEAGDHVGKTVLTIP